MVQILNRLGKGVIYVYVLKYTFGNKNDILLIHAVYKNKN